MFFLPALIPLAFKYNTLYRFNLLTVRNAKISLKLFKYNTLYRFNEKKAQMDLQKSPI